MRRLLAIALLASPCAAADLVVASKNFTENRILAEAVTQLAEARTGLEVEHRSSLGGTKVCWDALLAGEVDLYVEYTGTAWAVQLGETGSVSDPLRAYLQVQRELERRFDVSCGPPLGLNNTYALAVRREVAEELGLARISDLAGHGGALSAGFSVEFVNRSDGWAGLREHYPGLDLEPRSMEHALAYEGLAAGELDLVDAYSTDGKLLRYDVVVLEDDRGFFPPYNALVLARGSTLRETPGLEEALAELAFTLDDAQAMALNHRVEVGGESFESVARDYLVRAGLLEPRGEAPPAPVTARAERGPLWSLVEDRTRLARLTLEHLGLVTLSVLIAALLALPLGLVATRAPRLRQIALGGASVLQTVPSLALLAFLISIPGLGLGASSAVVALVLYAVLPILRNTVTGIEGVDPELVDAARGLGLTPRQVLLRIQLPLALHTLLAGLRTSAVISVGVATLAAFIGAGGLGQPIVEGLYLNDTALILSGALPAAALALVVDGALGLLARVLTPRGLREG